MAPRPEEPSKDQIASPPKAMKSVEFSYGGR